MGWTGVLYWLLARRLRSSWLLLAIGSFGILAAVTLMSVGPSTPALWRKGAFGTPRAIASYFLLRGISNHEDGVRIVVPAPMHRGGTQRRELDCPDVIGVSGTRDAAAPIASGRPAPE